MARRSSALFEMIALDERIAATEPTDLAHFPAKGVNAARSPPEHAYDQHRPLIGDPPQHTSDEHALTGFRLVSWCVQSALLVQCHELLNM